MDLRPLAIAVSICLLPIIISPAWPDSEFQKNLQHRTFYLAGNIEYGKIDDSYTADLVIYMDDSQYTVTHDLVREFQRQNPDIKTVYVATGSPSHILNTQILKQGYIDGKKTAPNPDLFVSTRLEHFRSLRTKRLIQDYSIYTRNRLALMVAEGNPKNIKGIRDLGRADLTQCHPAPESTDLFRQHGSSLLKESGLFETVTGGKSCQDCWAIEGKTWFASHYLTHTPARIETKQADVGLVWATDIRYARLDGKSVDGIVLDESDSVGKPIDYHIAVLVNGQNRVNAGRYIDYLSTNDAQRIYTDHGFVSPGNAEPLWKPIPDIDSHKVSNHHPDQTP